MLNVTTTSSEANGFFTVYPCGKLPTASNLNYVAGQVIANSVVADLSERGDVCVFTSSRSNVVVDVSGTLASGAFAALPEPRRILDSRPSAETFDDFWGGIGSRNGGETTILQVVERAGVPADASAVVLNVTSVQPMNRGFLTVHPRNSARPNASDLNFTPGENVANLVVARVGGDGNVCIYNSEPTGLIVDVAGYLTGSAPAVGGADCPANEQRLDPATRVSPGFAYTVNEDVAPGRYTIANPSTECFFARYDERVSDDSEPIGYNYGAGSGSRLLVDIRPTDVDFVLGEACPRMTPARPSGRRATVIGRVRTSSETTSSWGRYTTFALDGCYVEGTESFDGSFGAIFTDLRVEAGEARELFAVLDASTVGFYSTAECGTWRLQNPGALTDAGAETPTYAVDDRMLVDSVGAPVAAVETRRTPRSSSALSRP